MQNYFLAFQELRNLLQKSHKTIEKTNQIGFITSFSKTRIT